MISFSNPEVGVLFLSSFVLPSALRQFVIQGFGFNRNARGIGIGLVTDSLDAVEAPDTGFALDYGYFAAGKRKLCSGSYRLVTTLGEEVNSNNCGYNFIIPGFVEPNGPTETAESKFLPEIGAIVATRKLKRSDMPRRHAIASPATAAQGVIKSFFDSGTSSVDTFTMPAPIASIATDDDDDDLYAASTSRAEVYIVKNDIARASGTMKLTVAQPGTAAYDAMIPRKVIAIPGKNEILVIVRGQADGTKRLFRIRKAQ